MKKYFITGLVGLFAVGVLAWLMMRGNFLTNLGSMESSDNVFDFLPTTFDQLLYFSFDDQLRTVMSQIETTTGNAGFQGLADSVDQLVVVQSTDPADQMSLMFLVNDTPIDIASLQQAGLIVSDASYITKQLASNVWVYGDAVAVNEYQSTLQKGKLLNSEKDFSSRATNIHTEKYNVGMFSYAASSAEVSPLVSKFAEALRWTAVSSHLGKENAFGSVLMQFSGGVIPTPTENFVPTLYNYTASGAVAYIEFANLLDLFGIDQDQFTTIAALLFSQMGGGAYSALLSNEDYAKLYLGLSNHLALSIAPSTGSLIGLGAQIVVGNPDIFSVLHNLGPIWKGLVGGLSGAEEVKEYTTENLIRYSSPNVPYSLFGQQVEINRDQSATKLVIGDSNAARVAPDSSVLSYDDSTIATFMIDTKQLQQAMAATQGVAADVNQLGVGKYLQGGTVVGNLSVLPKEDQLMLSFTVK